MLLLLLCIRPAIGQTTVEIGQGTGTSTVSPIHAHYGYSYSQQLYTAAELLANGAVPGVAILNLRFYLESGPSNMGNASAWTVYMANSTRSEFSTNTDWEPLSNLMQVFDGTVAFSVGAWVDIPLSGSFTWDGSSNIVVAVHEHAAGYTGYANWMATSQPSPTAVIFYRSDTQNPDPASPPSANGRSSNRPNIQLDFSNLPCAGLTPDPGATISSDARLCGRDTVSLRLENDYSSYGDMVYQWQFSEDTTAGWQNLANATGPTVRTVVHQPLWYRALVSCDGNQSISTAVEVKVDAPPQLNVNDSDVVYCDGGQAALTAQGAFEYSWSPALGLDVDTGSTVMAAPLQPTLYTVTGTDTNSCQSSATVFVSAISDYALKLQATPLDICSTGQPITLSADRTSGGDNPSVEYALVDRAGTIITPWRSSPSFTFTPAETGSLRYGILPRLAGCTTGADTAYVTVHYGLTADVATVPDCAGVDNTIILSNASGAGYVFTTWQHDFNTSPLPANASWYGDASMADNRAVLTPAATARRGALGISGVDTLNPDALTLTFTLTADEVINTFGTGGADGLAWSFGDDADYSASIKNGAGSKLRVVFDAAHNGTENNNASGIYITYGYSSNIQMGPTSAGVLAYSPDVSWKDQTDQRVEIQINEVAQLRLTYAGRVIFDQVQLPAAYVEADKSAWKHLFTAFTGGDAMRHAIDDLQISQISRSFVYGISAGGSGSVPATWQASDTFSNLASPDSFDIWIASGADPQACNQLLGTYRFWHPITVSQISFTELTSCDSDDGTITLEGLISNVTYGLSYSQDGTPITAPATADGSGHIVLADLAPATYADFNLSVDSCALSLPAQVVIPEPVSPLLLPFIGSTNTDCSQPNGSIILFSTDFVSGRSYELRYNGSSQGSFTANASRQILIPGLNTGSYNDIHVITPQGCSSDTVSTFSVSGLMSDALITSVTTTDPIYCNTADGAITLSGNFNNGATPYLSFLYNGVPALAGASGTSSQMQVTGLSAGTYDSIRVIDGCPSNAWGPILLTGTIDPQLPAVSSAGAKLQGQGVELGYLNTNCERIATISSTDSLGHVTTMVTVRNGTQTYGGTEPYIGRFYDIVAGNNQGGRVTLYFTDAEIDAYNLTVNTLGNTQYPAIGDNGEHLQITAFHSTVPGGGPEGYDLQGAEAIRPLSVVHQSSEGIWEVTFDTDSFSGFFAHTNGIGAPLPITLLRASVENEGSVNRVYWQTAAEAPGDHFSVEHSLDGKNFKTIGRQAAKGFPGSVYELSHTDPVAGLNYYRIKSAATDGRHFYSEILRATVGAPLLRIEAYPNPATDLLTVTARGTVSGQGTLWLTDVSGRVIEQKQVQSEGAVTFSMRHLAGGIYLLKYQDASTSQTFKLSKR